MIKLDGLFQSDWKHKLTRVLLLSVLIIASVDEVVLGCAFDKNGYTTENASGVLSKEDTLKSPVFKSYKDDGASTEVFDNINLVGRANIISPDKCVFADSSNQTKMTISFGGTVRAKFIAKSFVVNGDKLYADNASMVVYLGNDSITHWGQSLMYDDATREMIVYNPNKMVGNGPYVDTYHGICIFSEAMLWNLDENKIRFHKFLTQFQESRAYLKSMNFYNEMDWDRLQGIDKNNPLSLVYGYMMKYDTDVVDLQLFAMYLKINIEQVVAMLMRLAEQGYLSYDPQNKIAYPTEMLYGVMNARNGETDYDVIRIESYATNRQPNMVLDLSNNDLTVNGVSNVVVSNAKNVKIVPYDKSIVVKKDLDFEFSGKMMAGMFEFHTHSSRFDYSDFVIELPTIDSLAFFVKNRDNVHDNVRVKDVITHVSGKIYIDESSNKSGVVDNADYPIFDCDQESQIDFNGVSFILPPFEIDSLFTFSTSNFNLKGTVRSGVFMDFEDELIVKDDYSLGFTHGINKEGLNIVNSNAKFSNEVKLNNEIFYGNGTLSFMSAFAESDSVTFDDTMAYMHGRFEMLAVDDALSVPYVAADSVEIKMITKDNKMFVNTLDDELMLYDNCTFRGEVRLEQSGFYGKGVLDMHGTTVKSDNFIFRNNSFVADSADVAVNDDGLDDLLASNYSFSVDFDKGIGSFKSVDDNSNIFFAKNKVVCEHECAEWRFDDETVSLSSKYGKPVMPADSTVVMPSINIRKMDYSFADNTIMAHDVDSISVADVVLLMSDGDLQIKENAIIQASGAATIHGPSITIHDAMIDSIGENRYFAKGYVDYTDPDNYVSPLYFNEIYPDQNGETVGFGKIDESDNFMINRDYLFKGDISFKSGVEDIKFDGCLKMINQCLVDYQWFKVSIDTVSNNMYLPLDNDTLASKCGLYYDEDDKEFFVEFFTENAVYEPDKTALAFSDELYYDSDYNGFINSGIILQTDSCFVLGEGEFDLGINTKFFNFLTDGMFVYDVQNDKIRIEIQALLDFTFDKKLADNIALMLFGPDGKGMLRANYKNDAGLIMSDLSLRWVSGLHCFVSEPEIYIDGFNSYDVGNYYEASVLIDYSDVPTFIFYLKNDAEQWVFLKHSGGKTEVLSSDADINGRLEKIDKKKHSVDDKVTKESYEYGLGQETDVNNLLLKLKYIRGK